MRKAIFISLCFLAAWNFIQYDASFAKTVAVDIKEHSSFAKGIYFLKASDENNVRIKRFNL